MDNQEKNNVLKALIDRGIMQGKLNSTEIDTVLVEADVDMEEMEKIYSKLESHGVEIVDDLSDQILDNISVDIDLPKDYDSSAVSDELSEYYGIATRPGAHCAPRMHMALMTRDRGAVRFSFSWFNTEAEVDTAVKAVEALTKE